jgi:hypothetical protein
MPRICFRYPFEEGATSYECPESFFVNRLKKEPHPTNAPNKLTLRIILRTKKILSDEKWFWSNSFYFEQVLFCVFGFR